MAKFNYFYIDNATANVGNIAIKYPIAKPVGSGVVDVYSTMKWKNHGAIDEVPHLFLSEYSLDYGSWTSNLARIMNTTGQVADGQLDPYQILYTGNPTGFYYTLPYLIKSGDTIRGGVTNKWGDTNAGISDGAKGLLGEKIYDKVSKAAQSFGNIVSPGIGTEPVKSFSETAPNDLTISFPLYNTGTIEEANNNFSFVSLLAFQNLKTRTTFVSFLPPKLYSIDGLADGSVYMPAAYISDLKIDSIGTTRSITDLGGGSSSEGRTLIPEAYRVTITFTEMIAQSTNIMWGALGGQKVQVIGSTPRNFFPNETLITGDGSTVR